MSAAAAAGPVSQEQWQRHRQEARQTLPAALAKANDNLPDLLLHYQGRLLATTAVSQLTVCEKSRRIGMTWAVAADAVPRGYTHLAPPDSDATADRGRPET